MPTHIPRFQKLEMDQNFVSIAHLALDFKTFLIWLPKIHTTWAEHNIWAARVTCILNKWWILSNHVCMQFVGEYVTYFQHIFRGQNICMQVYHAYNMIWAWCQTLKCIYNFEHLKIFDPKKQTKPAEISLEIFLHVCWTFFPCWCICICL